jgi:hypothetical protein
MKKIYQLSTKEYEPISLGSRYLFEQYDAIFSFLKPKIENKFLKLLAKPILNEKNEIVEWYSDFPGDFVPLHSFDEQIQIDIKQKYWELKYVIEDLVSSLAKSTGNVEVGQWIEKLDGIFNQDNNLILSNGADFVILWGWRFNSSSANYLDPQFLPPRNIVDNSFKEDTIENNEKIESNDEIQPAIIQSSESNTIIHESSSEEDSNHSPTPQNINVVINTIEAETIETNIDTTESNEPLKIRKLTFWERIKRFFRWVSYRFWALMLLIILLLLLCCLCKNCSDKKAVPCDNCKELDSINKRLEETKIRLKENCPPK